MRPQSLRHTLLLAIAVLVLISGILISQLVTHRYSVSLMEGAVAQAENAAHKLALDAAEQVLINDLVGLQRLLDAQMTVNPAVAYIFIVRDGSVISHTFSGGVPVELIGSNAAAEGAAGHLEKIVSQKGERFLDIAWPIFGGRAGTLRIGFSEEPYREKVSQLWLQMSLITLAILVLALVAGQVFVFRLTRPLLSLAAAVESIGEDNLEALPPVKGRAETSRLASVFNGMLARLRDYTQRLERSNQALETKNQELARAQRQLRTSLSIAQEIAALPNLSDVCAYLIRSFKTLIECRNMSLVVFNSRSDEAFVTSERGTFPLGAEAAGHAHGAFSGLTGIRFIEKEKLAAMPLPLDLQGARQLAVLPFHYQSEFLGAMLIGCPAECACVTKELDVIELILKQTSGALRRAVLHEEEIRELRARIEPTAEFSGLIGKDPKMQVIYKLIEDVAPTDATVLIQGESGTGKELVARAIHQHSPRREQALRGDQLLSLPQHAARKRALRPREGGLHRRLPAPRRPLRTGPRRHRFPGRDRRDLPDRPDQAAAGAAESEVRAYRRRADACGRCAHPGGHEQEPARAGESRAVPGGPFLPAERHPHPASASPGSSKRHSPAGTTFSADVCRTPEKRPPGIQQRRHAHSPEPPMDGKRAGAREHDRARRRAGQGERG